MRFRYVTERPALDSNYHVARADIREDDMIVRCVAYGKTTAAAESALLDSIADADIIDLGSV